MDDDDDFQNPTEAFFLTQSIAPSSQQKTSKCTSLKPLRASCCARSSKKSKRTIASGKENAETLQILKSSTPDFRVSDGITVMKEYKNRIKGLSDSSELILVRSTMNCDSQEDGRSVETQHTESGYSSLSDGNKGHILGSLNPESSEGVRIDSYVLERGGPDYLSQSENMPLIYGSLSSECNVKKGCSLKSGYFQNSIESRLLESRINSSTDVVGDCGLANDAPQESEVGTQLNKLMNLCCEMDQEGGLNGDISDSGRNSDGNFIIGSIASIECPLCGIDISDLNSESRELHTNMCLDLMEGSEPTVPNEDRKSDLPLKQAVDLSPVLEWLSSLGLSKYKETFIREEIDWDTLKWLTEEDLINIGIDALGPRKKITHALNELKRNMNDVDSPAERGKNNAERKVNTVTDGSKKLPEPGNKLITEFFPGSSIVVDKTADRNSQSTSNCLKVQRSSSKSSRKRFSARNHIAAGRRRDVPSWCNIPGTPFRVDAFRYMRADCSHWFLTHFHLDHYQGLTRGFCHGRIYCSSITASLIHMKIGVPWDVLYVLPLNQKICIEGIEVTCFEANHCPGAIILLFEPPNKKAVLHTGDFRFSTEMPCIPFLQACGIHTLILDTTYCDPQYDFPKQEAVIQFVIEAIQAEAFNPRTLFLIGSYTIGKERLFLEVARCLRKKVYVGGAKLQLLKCLELPEEDLQWFTTNEQDSSIHVVPMWTIASFKRMRYVVNRYSGIYDLIVAFSPTGWTFGKGKKKTPGRRWQQGTIIRYEVPYSEHSSFTELREFVQLISPQKIIPSVNNTGPESSDAMIALLIS